MVELAVRPNSGRLQLHSITQPSFYRWLPCEVWSSRNHSLHPCNSLVANLDLVWGVFSVHIPCVSLNNSLLLILLIETFFDLREVPWSTCKAIRFHALFSGRYVVGLNPYGNSAIRNCCWFDRFEVTTIKYHRHLRSVIRIDWVFNTRVQLSWVFIFKSIIGRGYFLIICDDHVFCRVNI